MTKRFSIGRWDIEFSNRARCEWTHFRVHKGEASRHIVWGRLSLVVEDGTAPVVATCAQCGSLEIGEEHAGDEGWTVCRDCRSVEQGYKYISRREAGV